MNGPGFSGKDEVAVQVLILMDRPLTQHALGATGNAHPGVLCGLKNQDLASSASGSGGYRQLRLDDTSQQGHAQLATTDYDSALTLGHLKYLVDNRRVTDLGYDAALASTQASVKASAKRTFLLAAGGAYLKLDGTNIEIDAPGAVQFKAGSKSVSDPQGGGSRRGWGEAWPASAKSARPLRLPQATYSWNSRHGHLAGISVDGPAQRVRTR